MPLIIRDVRSVRGLADGEASKRPDRTRRALLMRHWFRNIYQAVVTVAEALWVSLRYWLRTYDPRRQNVHRAVRVSRSCRLKVYPRFRGFHRYDLTTCIACERCARDCPVGCIYIGKERVAGRKGFQVTSFTIDYGKCMFCAICTENCPVDCIFMGSSYDLSCYSREGCMVDFSRLPLEVAWGRATLNPRWWPTRRSSRGRFTAVPARKPVTDRRPAGLTCAGRWPVC